MLGTKVTKQLLGPLNLLAGVALLVVIILGWSAFFSSSVSQETFVKVAVVASGVVLALAYFKLVSVRATLAFVGTVAFLLAVVMILQHPVPKKAQFQAVFLSNGQVYFGHLQNAGSKNPVLKEIYYLQSVPQNPQQTTTQDQGQLTLIKLGSELHGPEDQMVLKSSQILFWENLKDSSKVAQAIKSQKK